MSFLESDGPPDISPGVTDVLRDTLWPSRVQVFPPSLPWRTEHGRETEEEEAWDPLHEGSVAVVVALGGSIQRQEKVVQCLVALFLSAL